MELSSVYLIVRSDMKLLNNEKCVRNYSDAHSIIIAKSIVAIKNFLLSITNFSLKFCPKFNTSGDLNLSRFNHVPFNIYNKLWQTDVNVGACARARARTSSISHFSPVNSEFSPSTTKSRLNRGNRHFWLIDESFAGTGESIAPAGSSNGRRRSIYGTRCGAIQTFSSIKGASFGAIILCPAFYYF